MGALRDAGLRWRWCASGGRDDRGGGRDDRVAVRCSFRKPCLCARCASVLLGPCAMVPGHSQMQSLERQVTHFAVITQESEAASAPEFTKANDLVSFAFRSSEIFRRETETFDGFRCSATLSFFLSEQRTLSICHCI